MHSFVPENVCSKKITFSVENNKLKNVSFTSGCPGSLEGIGKLVEGMDVKDAIEKLKGIKCGFRDTSCPDQLSRALENYINK